MHLVEVPVFYQEDTTTFDTYNKKTMANQNQKLLRSEDQQTKSYEYIKTQEQGDNNDALMGSW